MKQLRAKIDRWIDQLDKNWETMPIKRQREVILYFFTAYFLLTAILIFNVCRDTAETENSHSFEHMQNLDPAVNKSSAKPQDSLKPILKK